MTAAFNIAKAAILAQEEGWQNVVLEQLMCMHPGEWPLVRLYSQIATGGGNVSDEPFGAGWDGETTTAPSQNAVYDQIQSMASSAPSSDNKGMACLDAVNQGDPITATGLLQEPVGYAGGVVNNQWWLCGDGVKTKDFYWSGDAGVTPRAYETVQAGDIPYLGTTGALLGTTTADLFSALYNVFP